METSEKKHIKAELRKELKSRLKGLDSRKKEQMDRAIARAVLSHPMVQAADWIYAYAAMAWEPGTREILDALWEQGKHIALPRVEGKAMVFCHVRSFEELKEGVMHIMEPGEECPLASVPDALVLTPGLAFTRDGKRLGKGGGYYDRFFTAEPGHPSIAVAYECMILEDVPMEAYDRRVEQIITESRRIDCKKQENELGEESICS